jgi:peptidoglycan/xylan/chitin deacetylase (PgdA/CDA1 family)
MFVSKLSILMYHRVGAFHDKPAAVPGLYCDARRFRAHLAYIARAGYSVMSLDDAYAGLFGGARLPRRAVVLTFDDGYQDFHDHALPILSEHGFPAVVFAVAGRVGGAADWIADGPKAHLMSAETLRNLHGYNVTVGSHGLTHMRLAGAPPDAVQAETSDSRKRLGDLLGREVRHFCYPHGSYDAGAREAAREAGYWTGTTCIRGAAEQAANPYELPRKKISWSTGVPGLAYKLRFQRALKGRGVEVA